jgi:hypothetical protein
MSLERRWKDVSLAEFTAGYAVFGVCMGLALLAAERTNMLSLNRAVYTSYATAVLFIPAVCAFAWGGPSLHRRNTWLLFWSLGWVAFLVHFLYAIIPHYHAGDRLVLPGGGGITVAYWVLLFWWGGDVLLAWLRSSSKGPWIQVERVGIHGLLVLSWLLFAWYAGEDNVLRNLSLVLVASVVVCLAKQVDRARGTARTVATVGV